VYGQVTGVTLAASAFRVFVAPRSWVGYEEIHEVARKQRVALARRLRKDRPWGFIRYLRLHHEGRIGCLEGLSGLAQRHAHDIGNLNTSTRIR
jgi:hypothetical protein